MTGNNELRVLSATNSEGRVTRREMVQRLLAGVGAGMTWPLIAEAHPIHEHFANGAVLDASDSLGAANWKPLYLNAEQNRQLLSLSGSIVPGSEKALVNRFIDLLLSVDTSENRLKFSASLLAMDEAAKKPSGRSFLALTLTQREGFLTAVSIKPADHDKSAFELYEHFENLKGWISGAYFSSEAGMRELGWTGDFAFGKYPECEHPEGHG